MNPILQALSAAKNMNSAAAIINQIKSGNTGAIFGALYKNNPQFRSFVDANKGKSAEQIARENGIDLETLQNMLK